LHTRKEIENFRRLKRKIAETMKMVYPGIPERIEEWKGQEIIDFQEELRSHVKEHISEKWFYMHMKSDTGKLPRIDILNFLSRYAGYADWNDFIYQHEGNGQEGNGHRGISAGESNRFFYLVPVMMLVAFGVVFAIIKFGTSREYQFCFNNQLTKKPVTDGSIDIVVLKRNESPEHLTCDSNGCFSIRTSKPEIRFVVKAPYYRIDTIRRLLSRARRNEVISLRTNDYALMIHYMSNARVVDWEARRAQLDKMISDNAMIYQLFMDETLGMEVYNKWEFINKITMPSRGLKNLEIIETNFKGEQISALWFRQIKLQNE
jgi:hypothetical protein